MKYIIHITPKNTIFYNLRVQSFTYLPHVLAILSRHLQGDDTKISLKHMAIK